MLVERSVAGRTLRAEVAERNARRADAALTTFERVEAIAAGTEVRFGWSLLHLVADDSDGALRASEPVFRAWPERRWNPTIDVTLDVAAAQVRLLGQVGAGGEDVAFDQVVLAAPGALDQTRVFLRRTSGLAPHDSGWLIGAADDPEALARAEDLEALPIAALVERRSSLLQVLALPQDFIAVVTGDTVEQIFDAAGRERLGRQESR